MKVLLDVDTGVDDAAALLYMLFKPQYEIVGIGTVCGNVEAQLAAENTLKILDLADAPDIPVAAGAEEPLCGRWPGRVKEIHGDNGLGNTELPRTGRSPVKEEIEDFYMRLADKYAGELTLITLGPLTNVARTLEKYPAFARKIRRMVMMGGTIAMRGNVSPTGEANVTGDPEACDKVFLSGMDVTAVGLDVTMKVCLKREHMEWLNRRRSAQAAKAVSFLNRALEYYWYGNQMQNYCIDDCPLHDPLAAMYAGTTGVLRTETRRARVECEGTYTRGMIVTDLREHPIPGGDIHFAVEADADRAIREFLSAFWEEESNKTV